MNYLILTPNGTGGTLLQRALTVYLNVSGYDYYNTHDLLNGLKLYNGAVVKNPDIGYSQTLDEIKQLLEKNSSPIVSRLTDSFFDASDEFTGNYSVGGRKEKTKNYVDFYKFCNQYFDKIIYCTRDPYEYALSRAIRKYSRTPNVYSLAERNCIHNCNIKYNVELEYFREKLNQYIQYQYWVSDNFSNAIPILYDDLSKDIDLVLSNITGINNDVENRFGIGLNQYSKLLYNISLEQQGVIDKANISKQHVKSIVLLSRYQKTLIKDKKLVGNIPIKMNTLNDKKNRIKNFSETIDEYNRWAVQSNQYKSINNSDLIEKIDHENMWYKA